MSALLRFSRVVLACLAVLAAGAPAVASTVVRDEVVHVDKARPEERAVVAADSSKAARVVVAAAAPGSYVAARRLFLLNRALLR